MKNKCSILITSCDHYKDIWDPFFTLFFRYWPDCPFQIFLSSNYSEFDDLRVNTIKVGDDKHWASNTKIALNRIQTPYVICMIEDYFLRSKVDTVKIMGLLNIIYTEQAAYLRLFPEPGPGPNFKNYSEVGIIEKNAEYRTSLMASIWNKKVLEGLLIEGETAWDFEIKGGLRSEKIIDPFLSVPGDKYAINYYTGVIRRGKWTNIAKKVSTKEKIKFDYKKRPFLTTKGIVNRILSRIR